MLRIAFSYYSLGMVMPQRSHSTDGYRFGFNGKEKDDEVKGSGNSYDFGARIYDPRVGRWLSGDPQKSKYTGWSPFHFGFNSPITTIDPNGEENIIVVGSEEHDESTGNKLMFMMQGIRQARNYSESSKEGTTILLNSDGYSDEQINQFKASVQNYGASVVEISNSQEVVNYINSKNITLKSEAISSLREEDKVSNVDIFSHGIPGNISLGYDGARENQMNITIEQIKKINPAAFGDDPNTGECALFASYACRTAVDGFAQEISNKLQITVQAFYRRSNYGLTFNPITDPNFKAYINFSDGSMMGSIKGMVRLKDYKKFMEGAHYYEQILNHLDDPENRLKIDGALFDKRGAFGPPKDGYTPKSQPEGTHHFTPLGEH